MDDLSVDDLSVDDTPVDDLSVDDTPVDDLSVDDLYVGHDLSETWDVFSVLHAGVNSTNTVRE